MVCNTGDEQHFFTDFPDSKVHGANMRPIWGLQDPGGPHVGGMNFAIWAMIPLHWSGRNISIQEHSSSVFKALFGFLCGV